MFIIDPFECLFNGPLLNRINLRLLKYELAPIVFNGEDVAPDAVARVLEFDAVEHAHLQALHPNLFFNFSLGIDLVSLISAYDTAIRQIVIAWTVVFSH